MLTPYLPYPLLSGGQIRTFNLLKNLKDKHEITLYALIKDDAERQYIPKLEEYCSKVVVIKRTKNPWDLRNILMAGFTAFPFVITRNMPIHAARLIDQELKHNHFDLIHAETFYMMPNIPKTKVPVLLVEQTIEYLGYLSYAQKSKFWPVKPLLYIDIAKIRYWETHFWKVANRLVTMSSDDKRYINRVMGEKLNIDVVANGVDLEFFNHTKSSLPKNPTVLFVGTFKWLPNVDAVEFLVEKIWPLILKEIPEAKLHIVGFSPDKKILAYGKRPSITVSGGIDDIRQAYGAAHVLLAPVRSGKGTRFKVLEALATGTPVVATPLSVEGIAVTPGKEALVSSSAEGLARETIKLLRNKDLQKQLSQNGRKLITTSYDWKAISMDLDRIYRELGGKN